MPLRVLIADDDPVMRMLLGAIVDREPALELVGGAEDAGEALTLAGSTAPDVVLVDLDMPGGGGAAAAAIRSRLPGARVIAISADETSAAREEMAAAGAEGYVLKGAPPEHIVRAILGQPRR